jgi:uncharacterized protein YabE (DUF348 family)/3D (Asp-Asp-Asp) domain-containing protein
MSGAAAAIVVAAMLLTSGILEPSAADITVNDAGRVVAATTTEKTVGAFLEKNGIALSQGDVLEVSEEQEITDGMEIVIKRALPVTIIKGNEEITVRMLAGTVKEALDAAGISMGEQDEVYPTLDTYISSSGITINVIEVTEQTLVEEETLYYKEVTKSDSTLAKGKTKVVTEGVNGLQKNTILVTYKNGVEVSRETVSTEVVKEPIDQVTHIGTYVAPKTTTKPQETPTEQPTEQPTETEQPATDDSGKLTAVPTLSQIHTGTLYEHRQASEPASSIIEKVVVVHFVTAYTWTGSPTATGVYPRVGTIAADPKRFPYGTKVYVPGYGYGCIEDTGGFRNATYTQFDLYMDSESDCVAWGRKYDYKVYILKD